MPPQHAASVALVGALTGCARLAEVGGAELQEAPRETPPAEE